MVEPLRRSAHHVHLILSLLATRQTFERLGHMKIVHHKNKFVGGATLFTSTPYF